MNGFYLSERVFFHTRSNNQIKGQKAYLIAENKAFAPIEISKEMDFKILGIVTHVIHDLQICH